MQGELDRLDKLEWLVVYPCEALMRGCLLLFGECPLHRRRCARQCFPSSRNASNTSLLALTSLALGVCQLLLYCERNLLGPLARCRKARRCVAHLELASHSRRIRRLELRLGHPTPPQNLAVVILKRLRVGEHSRHLRAQSVEPPRLRRNTLTQLLPSTEQCECGAEHRAAPAVEDAAWPGTARAGSLYNFDVADRDHGIRIRRMILTSAEHVRRRLRHDGHACRRCTAGDCDLVAGRRRRLTDGTSGPDPRLDPLRDWRADRCVSRACCGGATLRIVEDDRSVAARRRCPRGPALALVAVPGRDRVVKPAWRVPSDRTGAGTATSAAARRSAREQGRSRLIGAGGRCIRAGQLAQRPWRIDGSSARS
eukprot:scaffold179433_cov28-Tisochrysis_lutea.AAC.1